jgi:hypothetical protein
VRLPPATLPVIHCVSERQACVVREAVARRLVEVGLELHPEKTRIVYWKDSNRRGTYEQVSFTFCGYTFRPREAYNKRQGVGFAKLHGLPSGGLCGQADGDEPSGFLLADSSACEPDPRRPRSADQSGATGLVRVFHRVLSERGEPTLPARRQPSGALGEVEVQAAGAQRQAGASVAAGSPDTGTRAVRALAVLRPVLNAGRHEPYESRGSRADLWGPAGEIPAGYPAE